MVENNRLIGVMFVCMGNICRSPMAEAVFQNFVDKSTFAKHFKVASSAVGDWHVGERPHSGTQAVLKQKNIPLDPEKRSILLRPFHLKQYDYVLALDMEIVTNIQYMYGLRVKRLMEYAPMGSALDVPDPYYNHKFLTVFDLVYEGCRGLFANICDAEAL
jgi:protein-tyrosine phosphatase